MYPGRRGQNVEERKEQSGRLETSLGLLWSANLLYLLHLFLSLPPCLSLSLSFSVASGSRGVCGCREQLVVEKHPRSLATPLAPCTASRAPLSLSSASFSPHPPPIPPRIVPPTIRRQPPGSKLSFDFYERINAPGHAPFLFVS